MAPSELTAQRDTDWADRETRQSVSAGNIRYGQHLLRIWSYGQTAVVLSSVEAELYATCLAVQHPVGAEHLVFEVGGRLSATKLQVAADVAMRSIG